jgi:uncharacterized protein (DUF305 family)
MRRIHALATTTAVLAVLALAGCGGDHGGSSASSTSAASPSPTAAAFAGADVIFATEMISHHRQAVMMASIAPDRASSAEVKALAAKIEAAQQPEIDTMSRWLRGWGKPVPEDSMEHGVAGHQGMPGMMTAEEMDDLNAATGAEFDKLFLTMMIEHHEGAVEMAKKEQQNGRSADAKVLAAKVEKDQTAEIAQMRGLLR